MSEMDKAGLMSQEAALSGNQEVYRLPYVRAQRICGVYRAGSTLALHAEGGSRGRG